MILGPDADGKKRWVQVVTELSRAFALCAASDEATAIRDDVSFFQALWNGGQGTTTGLGDKGD